MEFARMFSAELLGESAGVQRRALLYGDLYPPLADTYELVAHLASMMDPDPVAVVFPEGDHADAVERVLSIYCEGMDNVVLHRTSLPRHDFILRFCERVSRDGDAVVALGCRRGEVGELRPYRALCERLYPNLTVLDPASTAFDGAAYTQSDRDRALGDPELLAKMLPRPLTERGRAEAAAILAGDGAAL